MANYGISVAPIAASSLPGTVPGTTAACDADQLAILDAALSGWTCAGRTSGSNFVVGKRMESGELVFSATATLTVSDIDTIDPDELDEILVACSSPTDLHGLWVRTVVQSAP